VIRLSFTFIRESGWNVRHQSSVSLELKSRETEFRADEENNPSIRKRAKKDLGWNPSPINRSNQIFSVILLKAIWLSEKISRLRWNRIGPNHRRRIIDQAIPLQQPKI
jgi:hypothetical protein